MKIRFLCNGYFIIAISLMCLSACTNGSGDSSDELQPSTNACSVLGLNTRVINGTGCSEEGSPVVRVRIFNSDDTQGLCSGVMLTTKDVLTAAHCFIEHPLRLAAIEVNGIVATAAEVAIHPDVDILVNGAEAKVINDVAILHLRQAVNLPTLPILTSQALQIGDIFSIYGYGLTGTGTIEDLNSGQSKISAVSSQHISAKFDGTTGSNSCNGDSGGPAIVSIDTSSGIRSGIVGVVSSGSITSCTAGDVSLYANVTTLSMLNFIKEEVPSVGLL